MAFSLFSLMLKPGQTGTAVWGRGELFPLGVFYAAACKGIGETDLCLVGRTKGESALASYRCAEAVFPVAGMVRRIPYTKGGLSMVRSCASASGLIWWASDWLWALWAEHETALERRGRQWAAVLAWVIVLIGSWTWNRWEAKRGPLPHDISRTTRADLCVLGVNALFSGQRYPYSERQAQYAWCLAVSQRRAVLPSTPFQLFRWAVRRCPVMLEKVVLL